MIKPQTLLFILLIFISLNLTAQQTSKMFDQGLEKFKTGYYKDASVDFTKVVERNDQYFEAFYLRGRCYENLGKQQEALADYNRAINMKKDYHPALLYRGKYYASKGEDKKAMADFDAAIKSFPTFMEAYAERAALKEKNKDYKGSLEDYSMALQLNDQDKMLWHNRGRVHYIRKSYEECIQDQDVAIRRDTTFGMAYFYRAMAWQESGKLRNALADYEKAISLGVNNEEIFSRAGKLAFELYRFEKAVEYYTPLIVKYRTRDPEVHLNRGISYMRLRKYKQAEDDFSRAIVYDKKSAQAFMHRGIANHKLKREASAFRDFKRAIELEPEYFKTYEQRGIIYFEQKRYDLAVADFDKSIALRPTGDAHYHRGAIRSERRDRDGACQDLLAAKELGHPRATLEYPKLCEEPPPR
jgi:tetratricopeptide (TPR) repeat protein